MELTFAKFIQRRWELDEERIRSAAGMIQTREYRSASR